MLSHQTLRTLFEIDASLLFIFIFQRDSCVTWNSMPLKGELWKTRPVMLTTVTYREGQLLSISPKASAETQLIRTVATFSFTETLSKANRAKRSPLLLGWTYWMWSAVTLYLTLSVGHILVDSITLKWTMVGFDGFTATSHKSLSSVAPSRATMWRKVRLKYFGCLNFKTNIGAGRRTEGFWSCLPDVSRLIAYSTVLSNLADTPETPAFFSVLRGCPSRWYDLGTTLLYELGGRLTHSS